MMLRNFFFYSLLLCLFPREMQAVTHGYLAAGDSAYSAFDNEGALFWYGKAHASSPDDFQASIKLVRAHLDFGEDLGHPDRSNALYAKAVSLAESLHTIYPEKPEATYYLAWSYGHTALYQSYTERIKTVRRFEALLQKTIVLDSTFAEAHLLLGIYNREVAHIPRAIKTLARILLGKMPDGTYQKALLHIHRAIQLQPSCMAAHFELAKTYDMMGEKATAISGYNKVLEMPRLDHSDWKKQRSARQQLNTLRLLVNNKNEKIPSDQ
jgi:tetratricopeptide (TPR) repeat protein